eukprot:scaffold30532_cov11-Prasinocladus_malaysianus.AAC.1
MTRSDSWQELWICCLEDGTASPGRMILRYVVGARPPHDNDPCNGRQRPQRILGHMYRYSTLMLSYRRFTG